MSRAVSTEVPAAPVSVKWPNDVLIGDRKVCGILAELSPSRRVVVGAGVNLRMTHAQLPVPTATSLAIEGATDDAGLEDRLIAAYLTFLRDLLEDLLSPGAGAGAVKQGVRDGCGTLGRDVRIELPGGARLLGRADAIDDGGRLVVSSPAGRDDVVSAGDVLHLRNWDEG
jgi:BirA family transcriptional regulator, biotin operon repressor / biotin---[acetyl-CoA-carboxylase] ligase